MSRTPEEDRLAWNLEISDRSPVVKGTKITANHVVSLITYGGTWSGALRRYPELTEADIRACLAWDQSC